MALFYENLTSVDINLTEASYLNGSTELNISTTTLSPPKPSFAELQNNFYVASYILTPIFLAIGLFGNAVTIITMASKSFSNMTSRYILIALACSDTTLLLTQPFNKLFLRKLIGYDVRAISDIGCKAFFHIFKTGKMTSSWLIVILCFERFIAVVFPFKTKSIITKTSILTMIALDYIFMITYNGVWTFSSIIVDGTCKPDVTYPETKEKYRDFLLAGSSFYSLIPMVIMAILTPIIVVKLLIQRSKRKKLAGGAAGEKADKETVRISVMLIGIVVAYVALVLPITIVHNLAFWRNVSAFDVNTRGFFILREMAQILEQLNYSINFFLYVLCSAKFRERVLQILGVNKCIRKIRSDSSSSKTKTASGNKSASDGARGSQVANEGNGSKLASPEDVVIE